MTIKISENELNVFCQWVKKLTGIELDASKDYLFEGRLKPLLHKYGLSDYLSFYQRAQNDATGRMTGELIDAIVTEESYFFRDNSPFSLLATKLLPELVRGKRERGIEIPSLDIWSAACSRGQEIYSIAMILQECAQELRQIRSYLLATDISDAVLDYAKAGLYTSFELSRGVDPQRLKRFFERVGENYRIKSELRDSIRFQKRNLLQDLGSAGSFDLIFCRNVAVYFSLADRRALFDALADRLNDGGILFIGSTESLTGISERYRRCSDEPCTYYVKI